MPGTGSKCREMEMSSGSGSGSGQWAVGVAARVLRCKGAFVRLKPRGGACDILSSCKSILINSRQRLYPGIVMNCRGGGGWSRAKGQP